MEKPEPESLRQAQTGGSRNLDQNCVNLGMLDHSSGAEKR